MVPVSADSLLSGSGNHSPAAGAALPDPARFRIPESLAITGLSGFFHFLLIPRRLSRVFAVGTFYNM